MQSKGYFQLVSRTVTFRYV